MFSVLVLKLKIPIKNILYQHQNGDWDKETAASDWLSCLAKRTGLPRLLLCLVILLSAVAMIWLCMSAAVTAPEQKLVQVSPV